MPHIAIDTDSGGTGLVTVVLTTEREPFTFLVDTGSNVSHIDAKVVDRLHNVERVPINEENVTCVAGGFMSKEMVTLTFHNDIFTFRHEFRISDLSRPIDAITECGGLAVHGLLGTDFLTKYRCHLDFKKGRLHLG